EYTGLRAITTGIAPPRAVRLISTKMTTSTVTGPSSPSRVPFVLARLRGPVPRPGRALPHLDALVLGVAAGSGGTDPPVGDLQLLEVGEGVVGEHVRHGAVGPHQQLLDRKSVV